MTSLTATGKGVGRRMVEHSLQQARERGFKGIQFNFVVSTNERAIQLYRDFGFDTIGTVPLAFLHPKQGYVDVLMMFKTL
jgi:ribosomal protein S18 acetylase RimI-like enzyme